MKIVFKVILLILFFNHSFAQIESKLFLEKAYITDIKQFKDNIFVATYGQGIYQYLTKEGIWRNFSTKSGNIDNDLFHCVAASNDFIWAGSNDGLYIYTKKNRKWIVKKFSEGGQFGNWIRALHYDDKRNILWIGRFQNITLYDVKSNSFKEFSRVINNNEKTNNINCISSDGDSILWFGAEFGVHKLVLDSKNQFNQWTYFNNKGREFLGLGDMVSVSDILPLKKYVWFATDEFITKENPQYNLGGLYLNDRRFNWKRIEKSDGLQANGIFSLVRIGNYILASVYEFNPTKKIEIGRGLAMINLTNLKVTPIDLNQFEIKSSEIRVTYFDGKFLWLGTSSGLVRINFSNNLAKWGLR